MAAGVSRTTLRCRRHTPSGKSEDLGSQAVGSGDFDNSFQPAFWEDPYLNKGLSDYDVRHNFVFNYSWTLPAAPLGSGFAKALASGWQIAGIVAARSGVPFSPELSFDRASAFPRSGGAGQRPNLAAGASPNPVLGGPDQYFDPFAFELPAARTLGNLPRNTIIGPGFATWDGSIIKNFRDGRPAPGAVPVRGLQPAEPRELRSAGADRVRLGDYANRECWRDYKHGDARTAVPARAEVRVLVTASNRQERHRRSISHAGAAAQPPRFAHEGQHAV